MPEAFQLRASHTPIRILQGGLKITAPGLRGQGQYFGATRGNVMRSALDELSGWNEAVGETQFDDRHTIVLKAKTPEVSTHYRRRAEGGVPNDCIRIEVPISNDEAALLLYCDEGGGLSFHTASTNISTNLTRNARKGTVASFDFKLRQPGVDTRQATRGIIGKMAAKVIKVIVVKLFPNQARSLACHVIRSWENKNRAFQGFFKEEFDAWSSEPSKKLEDFSEIRNKRSLLFVHGTFSTNSRTFRDLNRNGTCLDDLRRQYQNRLFGFNHQTLMSSVADNVALFFEQFRGHPGRYEFDVIAHSRGGLLARALTGLSDSSISEALGKPWTRPEGVEICIRKIVFVGTPNSGTVLAQSDGIPNFVARLANYVNMLPDGFATISSGAILALASSFLEEAIPSIPGLADQVVNSPIQKELLRSSEPSESYFAFTASYTPEGNLRAVLANLAIDQIFNHVENDLVVPTSGVHEPFKLPTQRIVSFSDSDKVHHGTFFAHQRMAEIVTWLK